MNCGASLRSALQKTDGIPSQMLLVGAHYLATNVIPAKAGTQVTSPHGCGPRLCGTIVEGTALPIVIPC